MREIKFRGKRLDNGEWVYGDLEYSRYNNTTRIHVYDEDGLYDRQEKVNRATIGQFTGLLDKDGKEIYEGDIVRYLEANNEIATKEVYFIDCAFSPLTEIIWMGDAECEVIGNIHEQGKEANNGKHPKD